VDAYCERDLTSAAGGHTSGGRGSRLLAAATGLSWALGSFTYQLHGHQAGDKLLKANAVEIDGRTLYVRFRYNPESILLVLDALPFEEYLHKCLLMCY
jgi:hypothetical protein